MRSLAPIVGAAVLVAALAACGNSDPLGGISGAKIASTALGNLKSASSVHFSGTVTDDGDTVTLDITSVRGKGCSGTISQKGQGGVQIQDIGKRVWVKPDEAFLKAQGLTDNPEIAAKVTGKWISTTTADDSGLGSMTSMCNMGSLIDNEVGSDTAGTAKKGTETIDGQRTLLLRDTGDNGTLYVTDTARPYPVRLTASTHGSGGTLNFDHFGARVSLTPPPAGSVVDASQLGM